MSPYPHNTVSGINLVSVLSFTGKERDTETGFSYFGARYYDSDLSGLFLSVDPMADKYPSISSYAYCAWNPVKMVDPDGCSGIPKINNKTRTITVYAKLYFYGSMANPELSRKIANGIASQWNGANATYSMNGMTYKVVFKIRYETITTTKARELAKNNTSKYNNFVCISNGADDETSFTRLLKNQYGSNSFWFNTKDDLDNSTTPSHEFGHGLGLTHSDADYSDTDKRPDIMVPRNEKYGSKWTTKQKDGTEVVNPQSRRVTQKNVQDALDSSCGSVSNIIF